jgi:protein-S-isoprenylcysteine O-methyltransferase Ste14
VRTVFVALRSVLYATAFVFFWGGIASSARRYDSSLGFELPSGSPTIGFVLMIPGAVLVLSCLAVFWIRGRGTAAPFDPPVVFVPSGPYRYVRNPMYIGAALVLAGYGLLERSAAIVLLSLVFLLVMHLFVLLVEEPSLERRFGESYVAYRRATNRWLPRLRRSS